MPDRVIHIVPDDEMGGGAVIVAHLLRAAPAGAPPQLALLPENAAPSVRRLFEGLPHRPAPYRGRGAVGRMARAVAAEARPGDLVHAHGARAALAATLARGLRRRPRIVYTVHGFHSLARPGPLGLRARLERLLARRVDATAFVSAADAALAAAAGLRHRGPARVIENGVAAPAPPRAEAPRDLDLLFVGRLVHQKNPEAFVETVARLPAGTRAVMIGTGEKAATIDAAIAARAPHLQRIDGAEHAEVLAWMARARLLAMTSRWEGLPTVAIEALMSGTLVTGFEIPPLAEILGAAGAETLSPPEPEALARRIEGLLAEEPRRAALAAAAGEAANRRFSTARMAEDYAALYAAAEAG